MNKPRWLVLMDELLWPTVGFASERLESRAGPDLTLNVIPQCALYHFIYCIDASMQTNEKGRHSASMCLVRQCVESLTIVEVGLLPVEHGDVILDKWYRGRLSHGTVRGTLERESWSRYGKGLWSESWAEFSGQLARAVQPYAHYSPELLGWQFAVPPGVKLVGNKSVARIGPETYDPLKASRITVLHAIMCWALCRILAENGHLPPDKQAVVVEMGAELSRSKLLSGGALSWSQELWPHMFFK